MAPTKPTQAKRKVKKAGGKYEVIQPPFTLKQKVGSGGIPKDAVERASQALAELETEFVDDWLKADITALKETFATLRQDKDQANLQNHLDALFKTGKQIQGQAGSFEYFALTDIARSMCYIIEMSRVKSDMVIELVAVHVSAIAAVAHQKVKGRNNPVANELVEMLHMLNHRTLQGQQLNPEKAK